MKRRLLALLALTALAGAGAALTGSDRSFRTGPRRRRRA